jgi:hypothetical protein
MPVFEEQAQRQQVRHLVSGAYKAMWISIDSTQDYVVMVDLGRINMCEQFQLERCNLMSLWA